MPVANSTPRRRVLIIEDVPEMRELLRGLIDGLEGFQVSGVAADCAEARLELLRRRPELVLLDEILPGESSLDLLAEIQADGLPVVLMTGMENPVHSLPPGVSRRLIKPDWRTLESDRARFGEALRTQLDAMIQVARSG